MIQINHNDFDRMMKVNNLEALDQSQMNAWIIDHEEVIKKSDLDELNDVEQKEMDLFKAEMSSFTKIEVLSPSEDKLHPGIIRKSMYIRESQIVMDADIIEKSEDGEETIKKAESGTYLDTNMNRKLDRVGQRFGEQKTDETNGSGNEG